MIKAKVIEYSKYGDDSIFTIEYEAPRCILAEINTHRVFSRNAQSSRAIPIKEMMKRVVEDPFIPIEFRENKAGMIAGAPIEEQALAKDIWLYASACAVYSAEKLSELKVHKQYANRLLEPFMWVKGLITSTEWDNFFDLRLDVDAEPHFQELARQIKIKMGEVKPRYLRKGRMHLPYISQEERESIAPGLLPFISSARCARVSVKPFIGESIIDKDLALAERLWNKKHWSPFEHIAWPGDQNTGNFRGWTQFRKVLELGLVKLPDGKQIELPFPDAENAGIR